MKKILLLTLVLAGCWRHPHSISGTYTSDAFIGGAAVYDTLSLKLVHGDGYEVIRRRRVQKSEGIYHVTRWTGKYDADEQTLNIRENGRVLYFINGNLQMGTLQYKKR